MAMGELDQSKLGVLATAGPYPMEAYGFVHAGLGYTVRRVHGRTEGGTGKAAAPPATGDEATAQAAGEGSPTAPPQHASQWPNRLPLDLDQGSSTRRHVNGQQLCLGLRDYAVDRFGLFAPAVFGHWHIHRTDDFGRMVFAMIKAQIMSRTAEDSIDDFRGVYDFDEAFSRDALLSGIGVRVPRPEATSDALRDGAAHHDR